MTTPRLAAMAPKAPTSRRSWLRDWREGYIAKPIDARTFTALIAGHLPPDGQP